MAHFDSYDHSLLRNPDEYGLIDPMDAERIDYINGLAQDCSNSIANTLELLQSCTKPSR